MARGWRLNPPPNWPAMPTGWQPGVEWKPDPEWGPAPVGWTLWLREPRTAWIGRHKKVAGSGSAGVMLVGILAAHVVMGGAPEAPGSQLAAAAVPGAVTQLPAGALGGGASLEGAMPAPHRTTPVSRNRRAAAKPHRSGHASNAGKAEDVGATPQVPVPAAREHVPSPAPGNAPSARRACGWARAEAGDARHGTTRAKGAQAPCREPENHRERTPHVPSP